MTPQERTLTQAVWQHRYRVLLFAVLGALVGAILGVLMASRATFTAEASFLIQTPSPLIAEGLSQSTDAGRYVADQVEIIQSPEVMQQAAESVNEATGTDLSLREFDEALTIRWSADSTVATAAFEDQHPETALIATNALLEAYQRLLIDQSTANGQAAIDLTDQAIDVVERRISNLEGQLAAIRLQDTPTVTRLRELANESAVIYGQMIDANVAGRAALIDRLNVITVERSLLDSIIEVTADQVEVVRLERQIQQALTEQTTLIERRTNLEIDAKLNQAPTAVFSPARVIETAGLPLPLRFGFAGGVVAFFLAAARAYSRSLREETIETATSVEALIGAPLLAEIPDFSREQLTSLLPIRDDPRSRAAEGYRFLAASLEVRANDLATRTVALVGTAIGAGKTTTTANLGLALARQGARILMVDADFGHQSLSSMFGVDSTRADGITELISGKAKLGAVGVRLTGAEGHLIIIGRGTSPATAPNLFRSEAAAALFREFAEEFDLVIVDTPPLLQVAYASSIVSLAGGSVLVVPSGSAVNDVVATAGRLRSLGSEIVGYTFNRSELDIRTNTVAGGSLRDVLGDAGFETSPKVRSRR